MKTANTIDKQVENTAFQTANLMQSEDAVMYNTKTRQLFIVLLQAKRKCLVIRCLIIDLGTTPGTNVDGAFPLKLRIGGIDSSIEQLNEILRTPTDFCNHTVPLKTEMVECINSKGKTDPVLIMPIEASAQLHVNQADEAYLRERINAHIAASRVLNTLMLKDMLKHGTMLLCRTIRRERRILDSALLSLDFLYYESN
jgi:hypothetical protein